MNVKCVVAFIVGGAVGSVVTWKLVEGKYKRIAQEEIDSVKEVFGKRYSPAVEAIIADKEDLPDDEDLDEEEPVNIDEYYHIATTYSTNEEGGAKDMDMRGPYVISPEEFGELDDYQTVSLTYYGDGVLEDDMFKIVTDIDDTIGKDSLKHFGEYEDDSVFVRNDALMVDYEILLDYRNYSDVKHAGAQTVDE